MEKTRQQLYLVYSLQNHLGKTHLHIRGIYGSHSIAMREALRLTKPEAYSDEQPDYSIIEDKPDHMIIKNNNYADLNGFEETIHIELRTVQS